MKFRTQKITALMASAIVGVSTLGSVSVMAAESTEAMAVPADEAEEILLELSESALSCAMIGEVTDRENHALEIR